MVPSRLPGTDRDQPQSAEGRPVLREMLVPASQVELIDTWDSTGLRATASHDFAITDVFVPERRSFWFADPPVCEGPLYRMPAVGTFAAYVAAVPLGIARHALEEFVGARRRQNANLVKRGAGRQPGDPQRRGQSRGDLAAGRCFLLRTLEDVWATVQTGASPTARRPRSPVAGQHPRRQQRPGRRRVALHRGWGGARLRHLPTRSLPPRCPYGRQHVVLQVSNFEHHGRLCSTATGTTALGPPGSANNMTHQWTCPAG